MHVAGQTTSHRPNHLVSQMGDSQVEYCIVQGIGSRWTADIIGQSHAVEKL